MKLTYECRAEIAVVERILGRKIMACEPIVMYRDELAAIVDTSEADTVYYGTFEHCDKDTPVQANLTRDDDGGTHLPTIFTPSDGATQQVFSNRLWSHIALAGVDGKTVFYGWKMTVKPREYGDDLIENGTFQGQDPWTSGHEGDWDFTDGAEHDGGAATGDSLTQEISSHVSGDAYKVTVEVSGMTTIGLDTGIGGASGTQVTLNGTFESIIRTVDDTNIFSVQVSDDFDGKIVSVKLQKQIS